MSLSALTANRRQPIPVKMKPPDSRPAPLMRHLPDAFSPPANGTPSSASDRHLLASLTLGFSVDGNTTRLTQRRHVGPLLVQKPLYPEGPACCHAIIIHPPGGVVGGDELQISARVDDSAHALLSTPGAAKWYRSNGHVSRQRVDISVGTGAALEWLPQETILFNEADVILDSHIALQTGARYLGAEMLCFGRTASGERFTRGRVRQRLRVELEGKPVYIEQGSLLGDGAGMHSPLALAGHTVCASLIGVGGPVDSATLASVRETCTTLSEGSGVVGATQMKSVLLVRYLGHSSELARRVMLAAWQQLRPPLLGRKATELRIWNT